MDFRMLTGAKLQLAMLCSGDSAVSNINRTKTGTGAG